MNVYIVLCDYDNGSEETVSEVIFASLEKENADRIRLEHFSEHGENAEVNVIEVPLGKYPIQ